VNQRKSWFGDVSRLTARVAGKSSTFTLACSVVLLWLITGPLFGYSDTWQLAINTATTIVTFLMVFLIQHTQNVDTEALQIKLDELIRATQGAHNALLDLEEMTDRQLDQFRDRYEALAQAARQRLGSDEITLGTPAITLDDND
jgi:low affinity Fe/Cu permease